MRLFLAAAAAFVALLALAGPARAEWIWPLSGGVITTYRNGDDPYAGGQHRGIDIAGPVGARVVAAAGGEVRFAGTAGSSGLTVSVRTSDGFDTSYLHLSSVSVREGEFVSSGHALGAVGMTGSRSASEPHLHFGVREAGTPHAYRNPLDFLPPLQVPTPEAPRPGPSPVPAPTPPAPASAPAPAGEGAPRRVPAGDRAPHRVPAGERLPRRVPAGGRSPRRVPAYERAPRGVPVGGRVPRRVPVGGRVPHHPPVGDLAPHPEPAGGRIPALRPAPGGVPLEGHASRRAPSGSEPQWSAPEARSLGRTPDGSSPRRSQPGGLPDGAGGPATAPGRSGAGPDVGWILACVGLLLAAALLGLTEDGRKASRTGRGYVVRLLRPLTGRAG